MFSKRRVKVKIIKAYFHDDIHMNLNIPVDLPE